MLWCMSYSIVSQGKVHGAVRVIVHVCSVDRAHGLLCSSNRTCVVWTPLVDCPVEPISARMSASNALATSADSIPRP